MKKSDIIEEIQSMLPDLGLPSKWQVAKEVSRLADAPPETWKTIGSKTSRGIKRRMVQAEAARIVAKAKERIAIADEGEEEL